MWSHIKICLYLRKKIDTKFEHNIIWGSCLYTQEKRDKSWMKVGRKRQLLIQALQIKKGMRSHDLMTG